MRHHASSAPLPVDPAQKSLQPPGAPTGTWPVIRHLLPYLFRHRVRILIALTALVAAKLAIVGVPVVLKQIVDHFSESPAEQVALLAAPVGLVAAYALLRFSGSAMTEIREFVFARVTQSAVRDVSLQAFERLHRLSLRFHLARQTGALTRDLERGTRGVSTLVNFTLYSILPTLVEVLLVTAWLAFSYPPIFAIITLSALVAYIAYTFTITEWRTQLRRKMNELDSRANARAIDALINYETVKLFGNERMEADRYDRALHRWQEAAIKNQTSLSLLNVGQSLIISFAVGLMIWQAAEGVARGEMTLGDLVLVNAFLLQLTIPLNFLGVLYRETKQAVVDIERLFGLLHERDEIPDRSGAPPLALQGGEVRFENVEFAYDARRPILKGLSFTVPAGQTIAVVGASGAGKSTVTRLLFRFYDPSAGRVVIDGQDLRDVQQASVRAAIGIVPQDTVLFNETLAYNLQYGRPEASEAEMMAAAEAAHLMPLISQLPDGLQTVVGERGLKLSGGEKQRVAIARALLKRPAILVFDEATSSLDTETERLIQTEIEEVSKGRTALIIAHRLSTIVNADQILVLEDGRLVEQGSHQALLERNGRYAELWRLQAANKEQVKVQVKVWGGQRPLAPRSLSL